MKSDKFKNVFILEEGIDPPDLNEISKIDINFSVGSGFKFDPTKQYGAWATPFGAMIMWELFEYMRMVVPEKYRYCIKIINKISPRTVGWKYTPKAKS